MGRGARVSCRRQLRLCSHSLVFETLYSLSRVVRCAECSVRPGCVGVASAVGQLRSRETLNAILVHTYKAKKQKELNLKYMNVYEKCYNALSRLLVVRTCRTAHSCQRSSAPLALDSQLVVLPSS